MFDLARRSGRRIVEMVWEDLKPRDILTPGAFRNAVAAVLAVSGSINCIKHLQATAVEAGVDVDVFALFNDLGEQVPVLSAVAPNGTDTIDAFEAAGGARALLKQLEPLLDLDGAHGHRTHRSARTWRTPSVRDDEVIRPLDRPFSPTAVDRRAARIAGARERDRQARACAAPDSKTRFTGRGDRVRRRCSTRSRGSQKGEVKPGHVLVVRGMGPKGGPGMAGSASRVVFALYAAGLTNDVAFVTDGQLSGLCNKGLTVAEVSPEAAVGGPLALVENGDRITIDVDARSRSIWTWPRASSPRAALRRGEPALPKSDGLSVDLPAQRAADVHGRGAGEA